MRLFLFGTLRDPEHLQVVLGRMAETHPGALPEYQVQWDEAGEFPVLRPEPGAVTPGLVLEAREEDLLRLDWYEAIFGYGRDAVTLEDGPAEAYLRDREVVGPLSPWDFDTWSKRWGAIELGAAREAMGLYPATAPQAVGQRYPRVMARADTELRAAREPAPSDFRQGAGRDGVMDVTSRTTHRGFFNLDEITLTHRRFDGGEATITREVFVGSDAVLVLPYDPTSDRVVLVEQFRAGPLRRGDAQPWCLEPVAGLIDAGEEPETTARRETVEEAGLGLSDLVPVPGGYPSPGLASEYFHLFVGIADLSGYGARTGGLAAEGEDILTHLLSLDDALALLNTGEINVVPLAYLLTWTAAHRGQLQAG
ncbi:MAG: NUDIX domain-containing protein [Pseudomonadota bacterium]